uniref:Uncharacterized protein n=1 Tax=viral metagenome TaxID=1070528 RepID=A0A6M3JRD2_9ZZZZ
MPKLSPGKIISTIRTLYSGLVKLIGRIDAAKAMMEIMNEDKPKGPK